MRNVVEPGPCLNSKVFAERRKQFMSKLLPDSVAIIVSNPERPRSNDTEFLYRQSSDVLYLSDFPEPQTVLIFTNFGGKQKFTVLVRAKDNLREIWTGKRFGPEGAKQYFGANEANTIDQFQTVLKDLLSKAENVYYKFERNPEFDHEFNQVWTKSVIQAIPLHNPETIVHAMRMVKSKEELDLMRHAGKISAQAHCLAMRVCRQGLMEYQIQAEMEKHFMTSGTKSPAYTTIVAGGDNAIILHYIENDKVLNEGELLLIDAACEYKGYAADITRTFPINGKFTKPQQEIYQLVLDAQMAVIEAAEPGVTLAKLHDIASSVMRKGLIKLGVLSSEMRTKDSEAKALEKIKKSGRKAVPVILRDLFMHGTSHWLGLDVHDVGTTGTRSVYLKDLPLKPGMVFTVEPGLYFDPADKRLPKRYRGIGVRIEDDLAITRTGHIVLSEGVPKTVEEIEELMAS